MRSLFGKLLTTYMFIVLATLFPLGVAIGAFMPRYELNIRTREMTIQARHIAALVEEGNYFSEWGTLTDRTRLRETLNALESTTGFRSAVSDFYGAIPVRSAGFSGEINRNYNFYELVQELVTLSAQGINLMTEQNDDSLSVRVPIYVDGKIAGLVVVDSSLLGFWRSLAEVRSLIVFAGLASVAVATGVGYIFSRKITHPLRAMTAAVKDMQQGDFSTRVEITSNDELGDLADGFNALAVQLESTLADLKKQERLRRDFLANVSHDLRTPLTTLRGFLQAISDGLVDNAAATRRSARVMLRETMRLIRLVNALLDLSKLQSGTLELRPQPLDFATYAEDLSVPFLPQMDSKHLQFEMEIAPDLPMLWVDTSRFEQIFTNLLQNAVKFTRPGDRITIRAEVDQEKRLQPPDGEARPAVRITFEDTGPGIPPEDLPFIWERFYKADKARENTAESGAGLGLVIVRDLVFAHGGTVDVQSNEHGTIFSIWLPAFEAPPQQQDEGDAARIA